MGRPIADVMSFHGADWLVRETREQEEQPEAMLDALKIAPGRPSPTSARGSATPASGSPRVGPRGHGLRHRRPARDAPRCSPTTPRTPASRTSSRSAARPADTKLPDGKVDLVLMVDVYHECTDPEATLQGLRKALKPGGRLVLVEFRGEDPDVPIKPEHKMTLKQVRRELEPQGFTFKESLEFLPWQHIIIFENPPLEEK